MKKVMFLILAICCYIQLRDSLYIGDNLMSFVYSIGVGVGLNSFLNDED